MPNSIKVSIVIPMFNAEPFISEMITSIINQTMTEWELIIVDDGSIDNSIAIVKEFALKDKRIRLICRPEDRTKGGNTCRNIGLENSTGEYVIWFDADDLVAPYCLEQRVNYMENKPLIDFAIFPLLPFKNKPYDIVDQIYGFIPPNINLIDRTLGCTLYLIVQTNIYRKSCLKKYDITWDEKLMSHQDADFNLICFEKGLKFDGVEAYPDYFWRIEGNTNSISKQIFSEKKFISNIEFCNKEVLKFENRFPKSVFELIFFIYLIMLNIPDKKYRAAFLSIPYFKRNRFLKFRLSIINLIKQFLPNGNSRLNSIVLLTLLPNRYFRYRKHTIQRIKNGAIFLNTLEKKNLFRPSEK